MYTQEQDQKQARRNWIRASDMRIAITDALLAHSVNFTRTNLHYKLDRQLDRIERLESRAKELYPGVQDSFTIATYKL